MKKFKVFACSTKTFKVEIEAPDCYEAMKIADSLPMERWKEIYEDASWEVMDTEEIEDDGEL